MPVTKQLLDHFRVVIMELKSHAPFTFIGALSSLLLMIIVVVRSIPAETFKPMFTGLHSLHVILSAMVTTALYYKYKKNIFHTLLVGIFGSIGITTLSDIIFPHHGANFIMWITGAASHHHHHIHIEVIDHWYIIIPSAVVGLIIGIKLPYTKIPHAGHVLLSTWASLFYILGHTSIGFEWLPRLPLVIVLLFIAVWIPCCISDIVFPMLFIRKKSHESHPHKEDVKTLN
ncbi:hypothetical protein CHISP_1317 [Chitinispirillum alkaliphilum]|nr:hypothetical protein CHISP_1317 [Chitinispirillum alkaliphilum]